MPEQTPTTEPALQNPVPASTEVQHQQAAASTSVVGDKAVLASVQAKLDATFGDEPDYNPEPTPAAAEAQAPAAPTDTPTEDVLPPQNPPQTPLATDEPSDTEPEAADPAAADTTPAPTPDSPTLPDTYVRSLKAYGWKDEEIAQNLSVLGDKFVDIAAKLHANRNDELVQWAAAGRAARDTPGASAPSAPAAPASGAPLQPAPTADLMPQVDIAALKEKYGDDEMIEEIVAPVNAVVDRLNQIIPSLQQGQQAAQQAEIAEVSRNVDTFFADESMKPFHALYGVDSKGLTEPQIAARNRVLDTAYDLMTGAKALRHQSVPLNDALSYAHEIVSRDTKVSQARAGIQQQAKARSKSITLKPSGAEAPLNNDGSEQSQAALVRRTAARLRAVFPTA